MTINSNEINKKTNWLFVGLIVLGLIVRLYFIFTRNIFTDEVFYRNVAISNSFWNILTFSHWIKDHGVLFLIILKLLTFISKDIVILRLFNLIIYIVVNLISFNFFKKVKLIKVGLIFSLFYSFYSYFVFMSAMISPFNLVGFFSILAIIKLLEYFFTKQSFSNIFLYTIFSIASFYTDFSSIYFFFGIFFLSLLIINQKRTNLYPLIYSGLIQVVIIIPGILYALNNFGTISKLNFGIFNFNLSFIKYIEVFSDIMLMRSGGILSSIILAILFLYLLFKTKNPQEKILTILSVFVLCSFIASLIFVFIFSKTFFNIFLERSFWYFYYLVALAFSLSGHFLKRKYVFIFTILILTTFFIRIQDVYRYSIPGRVPGDTFHYRQIINEIKNSKIIYLDKNYSYVPLKDYYLYSTTGAVVRNTEELNNALKTISGSVSLIIFDASQKNTFFKADKAKITIFVTTCTNRGDCFFVKKI